jgi:hypothetical protein
MSIPNDLQGRYWLDISSANPKLVEEFSPCLVGFLAFDYGQVPDLAGTGFIMVGDADIAIVITAKHVLTEGVLNIQRPVPRHAPSALFVPPSAQTPILSEEKLRAFWGGSKSADLLYVRHLSYHESFDIACCIFTPQEESFATQFKPTSIPLDTTLPSLGDVVHMVSQGGMEINNRQPPTGAKGVGKIFNAYRRINIRIGTVTGVYPQGFRQYPWQCFTTSIPAEPGMSGGFVYLPRNGETVAACGIVCADNSVPDAYTDYSVCGESVIACAWTALSLSIPQYYASDAPMSTLLDMMKTGALQPAVGGVDHIQMIDRGNGNWSLVYGEAGEIEN